MINIQIHYYSVSSEYSGTKFKYPDIFYVKNDDFIKLKYIIIHMQMHTQDSSWIPLLFDAW